MAQYCSKLELLCLGSTILTPDTLFLETGDYQSTLQPGPRAGLTFVPVAIADVAKALGQYCPLLRKLWLPGCEWLTVDELQVFLSHCLGLEVLDLRHCGKLDGRLSQLFVLKNMDGVLQGGKDTKHSESDDSDDDSSKDRRRESVLAMFRTGGDRLDAQRQETVERMITTSHRKRGFPRVWAGTRETNTRGGAMFDVVNAASAGRLSLPSGSDPPLWPQTELQQPRSEQESQQARWESSSSSSSSKITHRNVPCVQLSRQVRSTDAR
ncbi:hypothetical protein BGZ72_007468 [Mortierella alpina]|nr:hypothetical protein BGZ72_007468 [Mortierella alpina]